MNRKMMIGVIIMAAAMVFSGCGMNQDGYKEQAARLLNEKYDEVFVIDKYLGQEHMNDYYEVQAYSENYPAVLFEAKAAKDGSTISDEYVAARVCYTIEKQIQSNIESLPGYMQIDVHAVSNSIDSSDADMTPKQFAELKTKNKYVVYIHYCPQEYDADRVYEVILNTMNGLDYLSGRIRFYIVEEEVLSQVQNYLEEYANLYYDYEELLGDSVCIEIPFENGSVNMAKEEFVKKAGGQL